MKKLFVLLLCAGFFTACSEDYWDDFDNDFEKTNRTVMEVLSSAEAWYSVAKCYYTEPDGKGEKYVITETLISGGVPSYYSFSDGVRTTYGGYVPPTTSSYHKLDSFTQTDGNTFLIGDDGEYYWKVLAYDDKKLLIECNTSGFSIGDVEYNYGLFTLHKKTFTDPDWKDKYAMTFEEYKEKGRQKEQEYWESLTPEAVEMWIVNWLEYGIRTVEEMDRLFQYWCPEYYESTIKYILDKYR